MLPVWQAAAQTFFAQKQSTVDSFPILAGNVDLFGTIILNGGADTANDIHDLTPLRQLKVLTGGLNIVHTTRLKSLHGLDSLVYLGGLYINDNDSLRDLSGLNPKYIYSDLVIISQNKGLEEINGLNGHEEMYDFRIEENPRLKVINGLQSLRYCPYPAVSKNEQLEHVSMPNLQKSASPWFWQNPNLQTLSFPNLDTLKFFSSDINIWYCPRLKNLNGINPGFVEGKLSLILIDDDSLQNIDNVGQWPVEVLGYRIVRSKLLESISLPNVKKSIGQVASQNAALKSIRLPNVETTVKSLVAISITHSPNLVDVSMPKLKTIASLKDSLFIFDCPKLPSVEGFSSLENVNGRLLLRGLKSLKNLHGLEKLKYTAGFEIGGFYDNSQMDSLESLCAFEHFSRSRFDVQILNCPVLSSLSGLETLEETTVIHLAYLDSLKNLDGLINLDTLRSDSSYFSENIELDSIGIKNMAGVSNIHYFGSRPILRINNSHSVEKFEFKNLVKGYQIVVNNCHVLNDIQFSQLTELSKEIGFVFLLIRQLPEIQSLDGVKHIKTFYGPFLSNSKIVIKNNPILTDCDAICKMRQTIDASYFDLQNNAFPCNALAEVVEHVCDSLSYVTNPENTAGVGIRVSPNPARDFLEISWPAYSENTHTDYTTRLVSSTGQIVLAQKDQRNKSRIDVSQAPSGFYFLELSCAGQLLGSKKVVVLH